MGFGRPIMHGLLSWNTAAAHALIPELGRSKSANNQESQARLASAVRPGNTKATEIWETGEKDRDDRDEVRIFTKVKGGKVFLSNGKALMKVEKLAKSKL